MVYQEQRAEIWAAVRQAFGAAGLCEVVCVSCNSRCPRVTAEFYTGERLHGSGMLRQLQLLLSARPDMPAEQRDPYDIEHLWPDMGFRHLILNSRGVYRGSEESGFEQLLGKACRASLCHAFRCPALMYGVLALWLTCFALICPFGLLQSARAQR